MKQWEVTARLAKLLEEAEEEALTNPDPDEGEAYVQWAQVVSGQLADR
jgi:hypothetical protein